MIFHMFRSVRSAASLKMRRAARTVDDEASVTPEARPAGDKTMDNFSWDDLPLILSILSSPCTEYFYLPISTLALYQVANWTSKMPSRG